MVEDDEETAMDEMAVIGRLRKAVESMEDSEEILQTKIISPKEVWEHWEEWEAAAKSEINSMLEEKEALEEVGKEEGSEPSIQYGLVMTYVDDIFITGPPKSPERWHRSSKRLGPRQNQKSWGRKPFASLAWKCQPQRMPKVEMFGMSPKNPLSRTW